jgi:hypothetical protein
VNASSNCSPGLVSSNVSSCFAQDSFVYRSAAWKEDELNPQIPDVIFKAKVAKDLIEGKREGKWKWKMEW